MNKRINFKIYGIFLLAWVISLGFTAVGWAQSTPSIPGAMVSDQPAQPTPDWGTTVESVVVVGAWAFQEHIAGEVVTSNGGVQRYTSTAVGSTDFILAPVQLPSGANITKIEFSGCNNNASAGMTVELYRSSGSGLVFIEFGGAAGASAGCGEFSGNFSHTVDNNYTYQILWNPGGTAALVTDGSETLNSIRFYYKLQVSPAPGTATFGDVPTSHIFFQYIEALYASGITAGCGGGNFCPDTPLTRGQMAVFLSRALGLHYPY